MNWNTLEVGEFLRDYPGMSIAPDRGEGLIIKGEFRFCAHVDGKPKIEDTYRIELCIPKGYPSRLPKVVETDHKIPNNGQFHLNSDRTLCLGSPLRLLRIIHEYHTLTGFVEKCLIPFLYACSYKLAHGGDFVFEDLQHGERGIIDDYMDILQINDRTQVVRAIELLGMKRRIANKKKCPCGCGNRLGACELHNRMNQFRKMASRSWFSTHAANLGRGM